MRIIVTVETLSPISLADVESLVRRLFTRFHRDRVLTVNDRGGVLHSPKPAPEAIVRWEVFPS